MDAIIEKLQVKQFVETGTYLGHTCRYLAAKFPLLQIRTIEVNDDFYMIAKRHLSKFSNVQQIIGNSSKEVERLLKSGSVENGTLFFLDAHWYNYLPLNDEIRSIEKYLTKAIYLIHDFEIPERNDFGYDVCNDEKIDVLLLRKSISNLNQVKVFLSTYTFQEVHGYTFKSKKLRGYALVFQNYTDKELAPLQYHLEPDYTLYHFPESSEKESLS